MTGRCSSPSFPLLNQLQRCHALHVALDPEMMRAAVHTQGMHHCRSTGLMKSSAGGGGGGIGGGSSGGPIGSQPAISTPADGFKPGLSAVTEAHK